jgi:glycosyltransferase involved in cell wall biosynthesis
MMLRRGRDRTANPTVLQLTPWLEADEAGLATLDVVRALKAFGWRAVVASAGGQLKRELRLAGAEVAPIPFDTSGPLRDWQNSRAVMRLMRQRRVSLVHARSPLTGAVAVDVARRAGVPAVITPHRLPEASGRRDAAMRASLAAARQVIATSEFAAEQLVTGLGLDAAKVRPVPRWIDLEGFHPGHVRGHRVAAAAERCGITVGPQVVGVPIEVAACDGRDLLTAAVAKLKGQDFVLLFLGALPEARDAVPKLAAALAAAGLEERARFGTGIIDLPAALAAIDVLLVPATRPPASAPLASAAQAMGKPVIVTAVGALPELVMPAITGWLLPPDDPGEIAWALELALRMGEDVRERVAFRARQFIAESFEAETILERQLGLYAELLGMAPPVRATATRAAAA